MRTRCATSLILSLIFPWIAHGQSPALQKKLIEQFHAQKTEVATMEKFIGNPVIVRGGWVTELNGSEPDRLFVTMQRYVYDQNGSESIFAWMSSESGRVLKGREAWVTTGGSETMTVPSGLFKGWTADQIASEANALAFARNSAAAEPILTSAWEGLKLIEHAYVVSRSPGQQVTTWFVELLGTNADPRKEKAIQLLVTFRGTSLQILIEPVSFTPAGNY